ncbi:Antitermination protein [Pantoea ananatis]|uniref:antitermination protein n=1 Tax=Pantoea ananas TaxID=553 RepID=UPI00099B7CC0|nr:antitermination protein [Pantoea ananatis]SKA79375.1 Antitermination protein [Pantoea ananatis]
MSLESTVKYHYAKTQNFSGMSPQTSPDTLTGTDYIASMGMAMSRAQMGYSAFMGKVGISENDAARAVSLLTDYALQNCDKVAALRKLDKDIKRQVMQTLASFAFLDYCQSASSKKPCKCCNATGFIDAEVFTMKSRFGTQRPGVVTEIKRLAESLPENTVYQVRGVESVLCPECKGKCVVSSACRDCKGRGKAMMEAESKRQGVPVIGNCKRCSGRGFERIPSTDAHNAICDFTESISLDTWKKSVKPFYDSLIVKLEIEESWANAALNKVTA